MLVDDVVAEHPDLDILLAHPAFPWEKQQLVICQQKGNVYIDLSGWLPRHIDDQVLQYAGSILQDKVMFGTDYPPAVQRKLLWENAEAFLDI